MVKRTISFLSGLIDSEFSLHHVSINSSPSCALSHSVFTNLPVCKITMSSAHLRMQLCRIHCCWGD